MTPLQDALRDSVPIVALTGQVPTHLLGHEAFQEADNVALTRPCTKQNFFVTDVKDLAAVLDAAFRIAAAGRPGPVHVDLPKDVLLKQTEFSSHACADARAECTLPDVDWGALEETARLMLQAVRPVFYVGGGAISAGADQELRQLAELLHIPVTTTLMALGAFPSRHALSLGMLGMHGTYAANMAVHHADLLIAIGARFDDRVTGKFDTFAPRARIVHLDIDRSSISKNVRADVALVGDCRYLLAALLEAVRTRLSDAIMSIVWRSRKHWRARIATWSAKVPLSYAWNDDVVKPQHVVETISRLTNGHAIIVTGVGQHQMWVAQYYKFSRPRACCTSGGLGTMGYGLPAAIGAAVAHPERLVINIDGDGSFVMNSQELATCAQYGLPVKTIILNNRGHGMVRQWQEIIYDGRFAEVDLLSGPDFAKLAEAYGCSGLRITAPREVAPRLRQALATPGPVVLDVYVDRDECVFPMVPAGASATYMILERPAAPRRREVAALQTGF